MEGFHTPCGIRALRLWTPTFLVPGTGFMEDSFSTDLGVRGQCKHIALTVHFVSITITSALPPTIRC